MKIFKRLSIFFLLCLLLLTTVPSAGAAGSGYRLTIHFAYEAVPIKNARFVIYRAGEVASDGTLLLSGQFRDYPVIVNGLTAGGMQQAASTLYAYTQKDQLPADEVVVTNNSGYAAGFGLECGLYLVAGDPAEMDGKIYRSQPQLVVLKEDLILEVKSEVKTEPSESLSLTVLKKWSDAGYEVQRPKSITVHLLKNGTVNSSVLLTAENNWRYTWQDLDAACEWMVVEDCPDLYTVIVQQEAGTFLLVNTRISTQEKPSDVPEKPEVDPEIPQTGMVWWPVLGLLLVGFCLICAGASLCREERYNA